MPALLVIVKRTIFEHYASACAPGDVLGWGKYESKAARLGLLDKDDPLYLVTVRPDGERLWLVAKYVRTRRTRHGVAATAPNAIPITDITHLRDRLKFDNGIGITAPPGLLGNSLQTPRILTANDIAIIEKSLNDTDEAWSEPVSLEGVPPLDVDSTNLLTLYYPIARTAEDYDQRYETARSKIALILNEARDADLAELRRHEFDVWVGQVSTTGHYLDEMFVTFAGARSVCAKLLRHSSKASRPSRIEVGHDPVANGAFPEVRVRNATIEGTWPMRWGTLLALSRRFLAIHGLADRANDPYKQLAAGATEPFHFRWHRVGDRMGRVASEVVADDELDARMVPVPGNRGGVIAFARTLDPFVSRIELRDAADQVSGVLAGRDRMQGLDTHALRAWLGLEAAKLDPDDVNDTIHLGEVLAAIAERCGGPEVSPQTFLLNSGLVPTPGGDWISFAQSFDAYAYWGTHCAVSAVGERLLQEWTAGRLEASLLSLRTALYMMYRWAHNDAQSPEDALDSNNERFVADLLQAIKLKV